MTAQTRVLLVVWRLARSGGKPFVLRELLRTVDTQRFDVHVLSIRPLLEEDQLDELANRVTLHSLDHVGSVSVARRSKLLFGVNRVVRDLQPAIVHAQSGVAWYVVGGALGRSLPAGRLLEIHDAPQSGRRSRGNDVVERVMVRLLGFEPIVHSRSVRDDVASAFNIEASRCHLVPLGVDVQRFASPGRPRAEVRDALGLDAREVLVLYAARLVPSKRPDRFVDVAERFRDSGDVTFVLAGTGSMLEKLRDDVRRRRLDDVVRVVGFVEDLVSLYHAADIFLSTSEYEGFGLAVAEAMAAGLPVISTRAGGVTEVIAEGPQGVLVAHEVDAIAGALASVLADRPYLSVRSDAAAERARTKFDSLSTTRSFEDVYEALQ